MKRLTRLSQIFDLKNKTQAKKFKTILNYITKKNIALPILEKSSFRFIDSSVKNLSRLDDSLKELLKIIG